MALFKRKIELDRFLHNAIAATFAGGFPIAQVDPAHLLTAEQRVRVADLLRVRSLIAHYFALAARARDGVPVDASELHERYQTVLWHVLQESARSNGEAEAIAVQWENGVRDVLTRTASGSAKDSDSVAEVTATTGRMLRRALEADDSPLKTEAEEYCWGVARLVTQHSVEALSYALTEVKLIS